MTDSPRIDRPQPGYYRLKLIRNGPWVGARIWIDDSIPERPAVMLATMGGKDADPMALWPRVCGEPISEQDYRYLMGVKDWAEKYDRTAPEASPHKPIDFNQLHIKF